MSVFFYIYFLSNQSCNKCRHKCFIERKKEERRTKCFGFISSWEWEWKYAIEDIILEIMMLYGLGNDTKSCSINPDNRQGLIDFV